MSTIRMIRIILMSVCLSVCSVWSYGQSTHGDVIRLYKGVAPGAETWDWSELSVGKDGSRKVSNVTVPTLTVFRPEKSNNSGIGVVICPGGGFISLAFDNEGARVAQWLNEKGITAFVLKYRLIRSDVPQTDSCRLERNKIMPLAAADGRKAIEFVRCNAEEYGLKKDKIGILGFSAGGAVATGVILTADSLSVPNFGGLIYAGRYFDLPLPPGASPVFIAIASDDPLKLVNHSIDLFNKWSESNFSAELHIFRKGGHGFGMKEKNIPTDDWIVRFYEWLNDLLNDE